MASSSISPATQPAAPPQHQYGTRKRQSSLIKPSARLRQLPEASTSSRKSKASRVNKSPSSDRRCSSPSPIFPPPDIMLHPEDANSKVFLAIGRALTSVGNCAMTIKDLAELSLSHGLACQNASAAGQAITTYIRTHSQRCESQQDHPLLLRHVLSGTSSDDDLLPALHSRSGGAHNNGNPGNRVTNFRRGTTVWYLSKAAGAPCPFARAGIRLCEYSEDGKAAEEFGPVVKKWEHDRHNPAEICGQKRKRLLRGNNKLGLADDENKRPSKVKLTLRLRPSIPVGVRSSPEAVPNCYGSLPTDIDTDESMLSPEESSEDDVETPADTSDATPWSLSSFPKRSISCYTPLFDGPYPTFSITSNYFTSEQKDPRRRSPSVPHSIASLPPDSEDDDDYIRPVKLIRQDSNQSYGSTKPEDDWGHEFETDAEADVEDAPWESPGPRSPSASVANDFVVKQEPTDVRGMLEVWDNLDSNISDVKVVEMVAQAAASLLNPENIKQEPCDDWNWDEPFNASSPGWFPDSLDLDPSAFMKQEDLDLGSPADKLDYVTSPVDITHPAALSSSPLTPLSSVTSNLSNFSSNFSTTARRDSELLWKDAELLGPDSIPPEEIDNEWIGDVSSSALKRAATKPIAPQPPVNSSPFPGAPVLSHSIPGSIHSHRLNSVAADSSATNLVPDSQRPAAKSAPVAPEAGSVIVLTCQPCEPPISATQVEGISVYQMTLGNSTLLRRIDTDFVFVSPVLRSLGIASLPPPLMANAVVISEGSSAVTGTWVPLITAQAFARENPTQKGLDVFLSTNLFERFPPALQDFHRSKEAARLPDQFGPHFTTTLAAQRVRHLAGVGDINREGDGSWERTPQTDWSLEDLRAVPPYPLPLSRLTLDDVAVEEIPLSATEQEMFHELCSIPDWEKDKENVALTPSSNNAEKSTIHRSPARSTSAPEPLRRSKRVANANAAALVPQTRSRTRKRNSRCLA